MTVMVNIHEAKTQLSKLLQRVIAGEEIVIAKSGAPIARLIPYEQQPTPRTPGTAKGKIWIAPDFNAPLPAEEFDAFANSLELYAGRLPFATAPSRSI
jgi:prevent-host-death family protein